MAAQGEGGDGHTKERENLNQALLSSSILFFWIQTQQTNTPQDEANLRSGPSIITPRLISGHFPNQKRCLLRRPWLQLDGSRVEQNGDEHAGEEHDGDEFNGDENDGQLLSTTGTTSTFNHRYPQRTGTTAAFNHRERQSLQRTRRYHSIASIQSSVSFNRLYPSNLGEHVISLLWGSLFI
ncbi:hypothetical protein R6Q59_032891 [Mikania micrantha]